MELAQGSAFRCDPASDRYSRSLSNCAKPARSVRRRDYLIRDNDGKFGSEFMSVAKASGIEVLRTPDRAPRANAICERLLGSVRRECLDHLRILSEAQLYRVIKEYVRFFNEARPDQGIDQQIPEHQGIGGKEKCEGKIISFPVLNGLQHDYHRVA